MQRSLQCEPFLRELRSHVGHLSCLYSLQRHTRKLRKWAKAISCLSNGAYLPPCSGSQYTNQCAGDILNGEQHHVLPSWRCVRAGTGNLHHNDIHDVLQPASFSDIPNGK